MPIENLRPLRNTCHVLACLVVFLAGCHKVPQQGVMATVNGHPIFKTEVEKVYDTQLASNPDQGSPAPSQADSLKLNILHTLIIEAIIEQRAANQNVTVSDADVDAKLAEMKASYTEEQFQAKLKASNLTLDELRRDVRRNLTQDKLINKEINSRITVTDADVTSYYESHKSEFNLIEPQFRIAVIQVTDQDSAQRGNLQDNKADGDDDARKKIRAIKNRLDSGEDFDSVASMFSERPETAPNGGDVVIITESQLKSNPGIDAAITKLKASEMTDIIPQVNPATHRPAGYVIFKLISRDAAGQRDLSDPRIQQGIRQQIHDSRAQLLRAAYLEIITDQANVENFDAEQVFKDDAP